MLELAGLAARPEQHVDGVSLVPLIKGNTGLPDRALYWHYPHYGNQGGEPSAIILDQDWKLIRYFEDGREELYNLVTDEGEHHDVAAVNPARVKALGQRLSAWLAETDARMPIPNPNFDEAAYAQEKIRIRDVDMPKLEQQAAEYMDPDYVGTNGTWWGSKP